MVLYLETLALISILAVLLTYYFNWIYKYWERKGVPYIKPIIPFGNVGNPFKREKSFGFAVKDCYDNLKVRGEKYGGIYFLTGPSFMPVDAKLVKYIMVRDFQYFMDHGLNYNEKRDPLSAHLFNMTGQTWKNMRIKLTSTFTPRKMKMMFPTLLTCASQLTDYLDKINSEQTSLDVKETFQCFTVDVIGKCLFGIECNTFKNPNSELRTHGNKFFEPGLNNTLRRFINFISSKLHKFLNLPETRTKDRKFFINLFTSVFNYRLSNNIHRNDFVQILLDMKKQVEEVKESEDLTQLQLAAHAYVFFIAGFETSSTLSTFCLHELSYCTDVQEKLRKEVIATLEKYNGALTYEGLIEMKYMDTVLNETLRKYPPVEIIHRICTKDYLIPDTTIILEAGTKVIISVYGLHNDPEYYPNPEKFDPDRFSEENIVSRPDVTYVPAGEGLRKCIGLRFGLMQTKIAISYFLKDFRAIPHPSSNYSIRFDPYQAIVLSSKDPILVNLEKLS